MNVESTVTVYEKITEGIIVMIIYIQTCIIRSPLGQRCMWSYKTCDLLKEVQLI
jgi:hypothetical protein